MSLFTHSQRIQACYKNRAKLLILILIWNSSSFACLQFSVIWLECLNEAESAKKEVNDGYRFELIPWILRKYMTNNHRNVNKCSPNRVRNGEKLNIKVIRWFFSLCHTCLLRKSGEYEIQTENLFRFQFWMHIRSLNFNEKHIIRIIRIYFAWKKNRARALRILYNRRVS